MSEHEPTFTDATWFGMNGKRVSGVGLYCSCGWVWGMGSGLGAERAWDNHYASEIGVGRVHT